MTTRRVNRLNSLLKEVLSDVIHREVKNPNVHSLTTVTRVDISADLRHAKVYISVIGSDSERQGTIDALQSAAGYIATLASHMVVMRYFPALTFILDDSVDHHMRIERILSEINKQPKSS